MGLHTPLVGAAITPIVIETTLSHYWNRKPLRQKPTAHISYHVGLNLIRQFIAYTSNHTVEDIQSFTGQWVPTPRWVHVEAVDIPPQHSETAAEKLQLQLGPSGVHAVGGRTWWQWRREGRPLRAEWLEMRVDHNARRQTKAPCERSMLYVHGGAFYFGSVDEHRYQIQRHARKLKARILSPRYRLAPQFPFPCGLMDCLATYHYMLTLQPPNTIVLAGDSAGGGMVISLLILIRDQGLPMPAGAVLISPWVDLTHSFPSVAGDNILDYVPAHGFIHKPSMSWPPPNSDDLAELKKAKTSEVNVPAASGEVMVGKVLGADNTAVGLSASHAEGKPLVTSDAAQIRAGRNLSIILDGKLVEIKDQIQMYAENALISHPLVSPVLQPSLGGLPPLLFLVGGGEMLRDEQIYLAHKAAAPSQYSPSASALAAQGAAPDAVTKWPPTSVQLQIWDDMCHVAPTLSFTRPAKYMYRSIAQFAAWALSRAQDVEISIQNDDAISIISSASSELNIPKSQVSEKLTPKPTVEAALDAAASLETLSGRVGKAGDELPDFASHMIRQRVTRHGDIFPLAPASAFAACRMMPEDVGTIKADPVRKWMKAQQFWSEKFAKEKMKVQERRMRELSVDCGYMPFEGETPPPTALAGRRRRDYKTKPERRKKSMGLAMWSGWGSKHDEATIEREMQTDRNQVENDRANEGGTAVEG